MSDNVLLRCGLWLEVNRDYPGGVFKSKCAFCGAATGTSHLNYQRASQAGPVKISCWDCFPIQIRKACESGETIAPERMLRHGVVDEN